jgi:hypothetical protein
MRERWGEVRRDKPVGDMGIESVACLFKPCGLCLHVVGRRQQREFLSRMDRSTMRADPRCDQSGQCCSNGRVPSNSRL